MMVKQRAHYFFKDLVTFEVLRAFRTPQNGQKWGILAISGPGANKLVDPGGPRIFQQTAIYGKKHRKNCKCCLVSLFIVK